MKGRKKNGMTLIVDLDTAQHNCLLLWHLKGKITLMRIGTTRNYYFFFTPQTDNVHPRIEVIVFSSFLIN